MLRRPKKTTGKIEARNKKHWKQKNKWKIEVFKGFSVGFPSYIKNRIVATHLADLLASWQARHVKGDWDGCRLLIRAEAEIDPKNLGSGLIFEQKIRNKSSKFVVYQSSPHLFFV